MQYEMEDYVNSVNRDATEAISDQWDVNEIKFNDEITGGSEDEKMAVSSEYEVDVVFL